MREQLANTLNQVEDEWTPFPYDPDFLNPRNRLRASDRMYPPQDDDMSDVADHPLMKRFRTAGEYVFIGANGSIEIRRKKVTEETTPNIRMTKPGKDGRGVWDL